MRKFAIIFDMDGVIVDSNAFHTIALRQFCNQHGQQLTEEQLINRIYGRTNREWLTDVFGKLPEDQLLTYIEEKEGLYRELFKNDIRPVKGLVPFLDLLNEFGIPRAIGTSAPRSNVDYTLSLTGTEKYFDIILHDTHVSRGKPDPEIYIKTAAALGLPNQQCIVIEDSLSGVKAGQSAGSKVIGITTTHTAEELSHTDLVIDDFSNLNVEMLEKLVYG